MIGFWRCVSVAVTMMIAANAALTAQTTSPQSSAQAETAPPVQAAPETQANDGSTPNYLLADVPAKYLTHDGRLFNVKMSVAVLYDYTSFHQDKDSITQVDIQKDTPDLRAGRLHFAGQLNFRRPWTFVVAGDYNEFRQSEDQIFEGLDAAVSIPLWGTARVSVGKQKETFILEMVSDAASLPMQERILSPFFKNRNIGVKLSGTARDGRVTWSGGWFNDWLQDTEPFAHSSNDFSARVTGLPVVSGDGTRYLHLGGAVRYVGAETGKLRLRGRPESNVASYYVDTGDFEGRSLREASVELLWTDAGFSVMSELVRAWSAAPTVGDPRFLGFNVVASYVLTGEHRPYDRITGSPRRIRPRARRGAWEVVGRYSSLDLTDGALDGGELAKWYAGLNWWATPQWKFGAGFGIADLARSGLDGRTTMALLRTQWAF